MSRYDRSFFAGKFAAQSARQSMRDGDQSFAASARERFTGTACREREQIHAVPSDQRAGRMPDQPNGVLVADRCPTRTQPSPPSTPERDVLASVLAYLATQRKRVAWFQRMNVGGFRDSTGQYVRVGFTGCSDIIGQMMDGRFLAIECKRPGKTATPEQWQFLCTVNRANGIGFVAVGIEDVQRALA